MAFKAKDGSEHTNMMTANRANARFDARPKGAPVSDPGSDSGQPKSIEDDPEAMQAIDVLKQKGYTADDVAQAMGGDDQSALMDSGSEATQAAPLQIPGMQ